ncbi:MAG TPA: hypothetical protein DCZ75_03020 [Geobacter sp.]|nr:hypothetical protein [Geobacter sp.]
MIEGKVTDWGKIIEFGVLIQQHLYIISGLADLGILHFQFDLVDFEFMEKSQSLNHRLRLFHCAILEPFFR